MWFWYGAIAQAATVDVCAAGCDYTNIADALDNPSAGRIEVGAGTYGVDDLTITRSVTISGDGSATTTLRADGDDIFDIAADVSTLVISGFTWDLAVNGGGLEFDGETDATVTDIVVSGHDTNELGGVVDVGASNLIADAWDVSGVSSSQNGAVFSVDGGSLTVRNSSFSGITTDFDGAVIHATGGSEVFIEGVAASDSSARYGGFAVVLGGSIEVADTTLTATGADLDGGAIYLGDAADLSASALVFDAIETGAAGALFQEDGTTAELSLSEWSSCTATSGGAVEVGNASFTCAACTFLENEASAGGGAISATDATVTLSDCTLSDNISVADGGAAWTSGGSVELVSSTVDGNAASGGGGGLFTRATDLSIEGSFFSNNSALLSGGGIDQENGTLSVTDARFENNTSGATGGGIRSIRSDGTTVLRTFFCANAALDAGGAGFALADGAVDHLWANNVFLANTATGTGGDFRFNSSSGTVVHNDFLGGSAVVEGGGSWASAAIGDYHSNLVGWSAAGGGLDASASPSLSVDYDGWWENVPVNADVALGVHAVTADPLLANMFSGVLCADVSPKPLQGSPLLFAGDPAYPNPDGTRGHIGSFGGPWADPVWFEDNDADGATLLVDCNDDDPDVSPYLLELCNGVDDDCDGTIDGLDDSLDPTGSLTIWLDDDGDGFGSVIVGYACFVPVGGSLVGGDCDDANADAHPGGDEVCGGLDEDCDDLIDGADPSLDESTAGLFYLDSDGDGFGADVSEEACTPPDGYVADSGDCDDENAAVGPLASELCNGIDDDCDGAFDGLDDLAVGADGLYEDADGDGVGSAAALACEVGPGVSATGGDCDDQNDQLFPGNFDDCNGTEEDCDAEIDEDGSPLTWYLDNDADGYGFEEVLGCLQPEGTVVSAGDCDDNDPLVSPGAEDVPGDGIDQDCNGQDAQTGTTEPTGPTGTTNTRTLPDSPTPKADESVDAGCACAHNQAPSGLWLIAVGAWVVRRGRRRNPR